MNSRQNRINEIKQTLRSLDKMYSAPYSPRIEAQIEGFKAELAELEAQNKKDRKNSLDQYRYI